jgi:hypothetical protein
LLPKQHADKFFGDETCQSGHCIRSFSFRRIDRRFGILARNSFRISRLAGMFVCKDFMLASMAYLLVLTDGVGKKRPAWTFVAHNASELNFKSGFSAYSE